MVKSVYMVKSSVKTRKRENIEIREKNFILISI